VTQTRFQIHLVAGARPNFMKIAPLYHELSRQDWCRPVLVHTGQHYDVEMSDVFFKDLNMPAPDHHLGIGSGSHAEQVAQVLMDYEKLLLEAKPDLVTVVGDVNATLACALAARKLNLPVAHVEAGLRSRDRTMPEEINRLLTDALCDVHLTPSQDADANLRAEGVPASCIHFVGNIMIDSLVAAEPVIRRHSHPFPAMAGRPYAVATFHRPSNVDEPVSLTELINSLCTLSRRIPVIFPAHPRTCQRIETFGLMATVNSAAGLTISKPLGYADFMRCIFDAAIVVTDSGGVQEETTYLGIPCFTVRSTTERPITVTEGTNRLIARAQIGALEGGARQSPRPALRLWDGKTAARIADVFHRYLQSGAPLRSAQAELPHKA
jgi:UDP-N-acetylglucosamine 2-epimerase (non-hydrolysing)